MPALKTRAELLDATHPDGGPNAETVVIMQEKLYGLARFTKLRNDSKKAATRGVTKQRSISFGHNYGIYPENQLMILDIDIKDHETPAQAQHYRDQQLDVLSKFFHVPLHQTFSVITPTGGVHCYLLLPKDFAFADDAPNFPKVSLKNRNSTMLNKIVATQFPKHVSKQLTVDIRRPDVNTYVLGPGSWIPGNDEKPAAKYQFAFDDHGFSPMSVDAPILTVPAAGIANIQSLSTAIREARQTRYQQPAAPQQTDEKFAANTKMPSVQQLSALKRLIQKYPQFHRKRAAVKAALACCYSDDMIATICEELDIHRDSSKDYVLSHDVVVKDLQRLEIAEPKHNSYCQAARKRIANRKVATYQDATPPTEDTLRAHAAAVIQRKKAFPTGEARRRSVHPAVIDMGAVYDTLTATTNRKVLPQRITDALDIMDYYVQPLTNYGVQQIILSRSDIRKTLHFTESRAAAAMKLLRETHILTIDVPPMPGRTTTYAVNMEYFHQDLTWALRKVWGYNNARRKVLRETHPAAVYFDRMRGQFREVFTGKIVVTPDYKVAAILEQKILRVDHPVRQSTGAGAALRYIRTEAQQHHVEVVPVDDTYYVIDASTGEVVVHDWNTHETIEVLQKKEYLQKKAALDASREDAAQRDENAKPGETTNKSSEGGRTPILTQRTSVTAPDHTPPIRLPLVEKDQQMTTHTFKIPKPSDDSSQEVWDAYHHTIQSLEAKKRRHDAQQRLAKMTPDELRDVLRDI